MNRQLQAGIAAVKAGEKEQARTLLLQLLQADEENEQAWLWLSAAVETDEERRVCLENVLTLNPDHIAARKGLAKLGADWQAPNRPEIQTDVEMSNPATSHQQPTDQEYVVRRQLTPLSPAAAILYPERLVQEWRWRDPTLVQQAAHSGYQSASTFNDVWARDTDICAYCAEELVEAETDCPRCGRSLMRRHYRYPQPSSNIIILCTLLIGLGQLFLIHAFYQLIAEHNTVKAALSAVMVLGAWGLAAGIYWRQSWAHLGSIVLLLLFLFAHGLNLFFPVDLSPLGLDNYDPAITNFVAPLMSGVGSFLVVFQLVTAVLALFFAVFKVASDFEQVEERLTAKLKRGLKAGSDYHLAAKEFTRSGMLATAVLHCQRAAASEPNQVAYQRALAHTYARLGFYERSLNVLQAAHDRFTSPPTRAELEKMIAAVQHMAAKRT